MKTDIKTFQKTVWDYYADHKRAMPWRETTDPYKILVSEMMLQQTQVSRVVTKYKDFLNSFPTVADLAQAQLGEVVRAWSGLGYNRRAKFLWQTAQIIRDNYDGMVPETTEELAKLPGIGKNTVGAIVAYAFNQPVTFVETNIRTVFIYHFFFDQTAVTDKQIENVLKTTVPETSVREWYWALMDYGAYLKQQGNNIKQSKHYTKQSRFAGSRRQIRGKVLGVLKDGPASFVEIQNIIVDDRLPMVVQALESEGFVILSKDRYRLC